MTGLVEMSEIMAKDARILQLEEEVARLKGTHQHYPTADAYEAACAALSKKTVECEELREELERERAIRTLERDEQKKNGNLLHPEVMLRFDILRITGSLSAAEAQYRWVTTGRAPAIEEIV